MHFSDDNCRDACWREGKKNKHQAPHYCPSELLCKWSVKFWFIALCYNFFVLLIMIKGTAAWWRMEGKAVKKKKESPHFDLLEIRHGNGQMIYTFAQQLVSNQLQSLNGIPQIPIIEMQYKKASQVQDGDFPLPFQPYTHIWIRNTIYSHEYFSLQQWNQVHFIALCLWYSSQLKSESSGDYAQVKTGFTTR